MIPSSRTHPLLQAAAIGLICGSVTMVYADEQPSDTAAEPIPPLVDDPSVAHEHPHPHRHEGGVERERDASTEGEHDHAGHGQGGAQHGHGSHEHAAHGHHSHAVHGHDAHVPGAQPSADGQEADVAEDQQVEVTVRGRRLPPSASALTVAGGELKLRPRLRPADVLEVTPGLMTVQHSGGGKANQYFLRGFDIDHGTDLALFVDGVPVNLVSHGHGQGYADMHFLIPELVSSLHAYKGPYYAQFGDFATAGAVNLELADVFHQSQLALSVGQSGVLRLLAIVSRELSYDTRFMVAAEAYAQDGPFENGEDLQRFNAALKATHVLTPESSVTFSWLSYVGDWNASGQIPIREVNAGRLDRFGSIDPSEGGHVQRHSASVRYEVQTDEVDLDVLVYGVQYDWGLFSNFTFFLNDRDDGDMIEQVDTRRMAGLNARTRFHHHFGQLRLETTVGVQARTDAIENALHRSPERERRSTMVDADIAQSSIGLYAQERARITPWLTAIAGLRLDRASVSVEDHLEDVSTLGNRSGGSAAQTLLSPKVSLTLSPLPALNLFINVGRGFHSNDARGVVRAKDPATLLVPALGYEFGARVSPSDNVSLTATAYRLDLESEQVFVGDEGTTEPSDPSTRVGLELSARFRLDNWLFADFAGTFNRAEFGNLGGVVALAPTRTLSAGLSFRAPFGSFGSLRVRHIGERAASQDQSITAEGWTVVDLRAGHRWKQFELGLDVQNLFNTEWREVQFATQSQLQTENSPVEEIHFAPGWPRTLRGTLTAYF